MLVSGLVLILVAMTLPAAPAEAITGQETLARAQSRVDAHAGYSMSGYYATAAVVRGTR
jgi:hypothetical protein